MKTVTKLWMAEISPQGRREGQGAGDGKQRQVENN